MTFRYCFNGDDWEYEPDYEDLKKYLVEILCDECRYKFGDKFDAVGAKQMAEFVVKQCDVFDVLCETYEDYLQESCEDDAREEYKDAIAFQKDEADWFGTKKDILG